jgi:thymidylate kinase
LNAIAQALLMLPNRLQFNRDGKRKFPGLFIALYGPDGAGKSAVAARVADELTPLFSGLQLHHLRIPLWRSPSQIVVVSDPHAQPPRGLVLSCLKLFYMFAQSWLAHLLRVLVWVACGQLVIVDRHFLDYAIDPQRYRLAASSVRLASLLGKFAPAPDLQFVLDVPAEELQRRKAEVTPGESRRQRQEYAARIGRLSNTVVVNADRPVSDVSIEIIRKISKLRHHRSWTASAALQRAESMEVQPANFVEP